MAKLSKTVVDKALRTLVFNDLMEGNVTGFHYCRINDRQYGVIVVDLNGHERYIRIGAIVAEEREDMTARELMQKEIDDYNQKQADKAEKAKAKEKKIAKDKARREKEKENENEL